VKVTRTRNRNITRAEPKSKGTRGEGLRTSGKIRPCKSLIPNPESRVLSLAFGAENSSLSLTPLLWFSNMTRGVAFGPSKKMGRMSPARQSHAGRRTRAGSPEVEIPDKLYFRIGEVSRMLRTKPFVLRYWETEFPTLKPEKGRSGHRLYRRKDVETVVQIRRLLYDEGYTIEGARKRIAELSRKRAEQKSLFHVAPDGTHLRSLKRELESVLTILSRKC